MTAHILLIEDDTRLAEMVSAYLHTHGLSASHASTGQAGLERLVDETTAADLVLLDLMLPDMDGLEVCRRIRALDGAAARTPVLMLTAKGDPMDRIIGLEMGADDYLAKPFEPRELLARIRAVLRRAPQAAHEAQQDDTVLRFGRLSIHPDTRRVLLGDQAVELTAHQFDLLWVLAKRPGRVLSREQIMELVRGKELEAYDRSIDVHMGRIRAAIEDDVKAPKRILTVRGVGYVFAKQQD